MITAQAPAVTPTVPAMAVQCAWCGRVKHEGHYSGPRVPVVPRLGGVPVSHGICPTCCERVLRENGYDPQKLAG